jgi:hypothetical protein
MAYSDKTGFSSWSHNPSNDGVIPAGTTSPKVGWNGNLETMKEWINWFWGALRASTGHTHTGADGDGPNLPAASITEGTEGYVLTSGATASAWAAPADKTYRIGHTYAISGEIKVPLGDTDFVPPFFVSLATGQTAKVVSCRYRINSGTSATVKVQKNGVDVTGLTAISVTTITASTTPAYDATQDLADTDMLALVVTAVSGTPTNLSFTLFIENTQ